MNYLEYYLEARERGLSHQDADAEAKRRVHKDEDYHFGLLIAFFITAILLALSPLIYNYL